jgi:hypothetical protein
VFLVGISCSVTAAAGFLCVPRWGVRGGAMAVLTTSSAMLLLFFGALGWVIHRKARSHRTLGVPAPTTDAAFPGGVR